MNEANTATVHGVPGERARAAGVMRAIWPLLTALFLCGVFVGAVLPRIGTGAAGAGFLAAALFLLWAVRDGLRGISAFFKGARGEESVAARLAALPAGYHVFHDVPCGASGGIDHVVAGPSGLFAVETKCWAGRVTCEAGRVLIDGRVPSRPPLVQARLSAAALSEFLRERLESAPTCAPVLCFASDTFEADRLACDDAVICNASALCSVIEGRAGRLCSEDIERISKVMERLTS